MTPHDKTKYEDLQPLGKFVLVELVEEKKAEKRTPSGIIIPGSAGDQPATFALVWGVGPEVTYGVQNGDFIEANTSFYAQFKGIDGRSFQLIHQDVIAGVYKKK